MSHWTHLITEDDISATPEVDVFHFSFNNPEALRTEIIEMLAEEDEDIAIAEANAKAEWKEFLDSLPAWQRQWDEAPLRRLKEFKERRDAELSRWDIPVPEGFDEAYAEAMEREARRAEHEGLMVCGDDEWGMR
jgi:hypothetical protein